MVAIIPLIDPIGFTGALEPESGFRHLKGLQLWQHVLELLVEGG